jgi:hypothetical protein
MFITPFDDMILQRHIELTFCFVCLLRNNRVPEFKWKLRPTVTCTIQGTEESCEDYMANVSTETQSCPIDVVYTYTVENIGNKCELINSVVATIDDANELSIPASNWPELNWNFCPGQTVALDDNRDQEDLCAMAGDEIDFKLALNDEDGFPGKTLFEYPLPGVTP